jgi:hypothetical protein
MILENLIDKNEDYEERLRQFIKGCEDALETKETIEFQ